MEYLFTYGSLQDEVIQKHLFGRTLKGWPDAIKGFVLSEQSAYGKYPVVKKTFDQTQSISGMVYELTEQELEEADVYEGDAYQRIKADLNSGKQAWLYIGS
jgi:gamma-glutamylcyclotransferase (GGCT)/AIG2-like uncharacterized protein YtfP